MNAETKLNNQRGFTLLEVMVSVFISTIIFSSIYLVLSMAQNIMRSNDLYGRLDQDAMQSLRSISSEIGQTSPNAAPSHLSITTSGGNSIVRFQIPVDWDNDGDADTGGLNPQTEWGAYDTLGNLSNGRLGGWVRYSVTGTQLIRDVLDSSLNLVSGASKVIANNVQTFVVTKAQSNVTMTLTLRDTDLIGQKGSAQRQFQSTVLTTTLLRNAVS